MRTRISLSSSLRLAALLGASLFATSSSAADGSVAVGRDIAESYCARCHAVGRTDLSPIQEAPPFRTLHTRYPVDMLAEALAEGIVVGHPMMPKFELNPEQIDGLIAYLKSLERRK